jgi:predicted ribosomally synthesized peptide with SipW-like signal peptide
MKTKSKALALALCAVLLVVTTVFMTMAYFTDTATVENKFTVGDVSIKLDELTVADDGITPGTTRTEEGNKYHLFPGQSYTKDPTITVDSNSEDCYLFVVVKNDLADIISGTSIEGQMAGYGWVLVRGETNVYYLTEEVEDKETQEKQTVPVISEAGDEVHVFDSFTISSDVDGDDLADYANATITVTAYAVQANGFDTPADAWDAAGFEVTDSSAEETAPVTTETSSIG